jgi:hypothetical protein
MLGQYEATSLLPASFALVLWGAIEKGKASINAAKL